MQRRLLSGVGRRDLFEVPPPAREQVKRAGLAPTTRAAVASGGGLPARAPRSEGATRLPATLLASAPRRDSNEAGWRVAGRVWGALGSSPSASGRGNLQ
mmetsp:Transcript_35754/g.118459  ORF Transcript_35754/g.118459 Transcript_35754/m.118459 type:complete len:99 (-) Transcript_35754:261-557(-)